AHTHGLPATWPTHGPWTDLPTYPFQHQPYWLTPTTHTPTDATALGQQPAGHPLLGAAINLPDHSTLFTGRLSLTTHPWLTDHAVHGTVILPGTAHLDLALHAATHLGHHHIDTLTLETPLTLTDDQTLTLQLTLTPPDPNGTHTITIHTHTDTDTGPGTWTRHATATLTPTPPTTNQPQPPTTWPPTHAQPINTHGLYQHLATLGYDYGPTFQGLHTAWRHNDTVYADITLPTNTPTTGHTLHPALLDAALHTLLVGTDGEEIRLPYEFTGVKVYGTGVDAARVQASLGADGTARITLTDASGSALMDIEALATRQADAAQLASLARSAHRTPLLTCEWGEVAQDAEPSTTVRNAVIGEVVPGLPDGTPVHPDLDALTAAVTDGAPIPDHAILHLPPTTGDPVEATHTLTATTLTTLQQWLADDRFTHTHLTVLTHHATTPTPDLAHAAIWGLTRSAQTEHPDRITLLDTDTTTTTELHPIPDPTTLTRHPQLAWHNNTLTTPRLTPTT
ncbi:polyketide synthase dehydratase domain-containing protein, partial [Streptomyces sp. NPDC127100]|uniref:polyketide synthase dehydratase domain-containing protein n=1 Tax=Streptomyces sp. NPDC127100 TaxID=3347138 RepID=UPI00365735EB